MDGDVAKGGGAETEVNYWGIDCCGGNYWWDARQKLWCDEKSGLYEEEVLQTVLYESRD